MEKLSMITSLVTTLLVVFLGYLFFRSYDMILKLLREIFEKLLNR